MHHFVNWVIFLFSHFLELFQRPYAKPCDRAGKQFGLIALDKLLSFVKVVRNVGLNYLMNFLLNFFLRPASLGILHAATEKRRIIFNKGVLIIA